MEMIDCPAHQGAYDCTPFCRICEGEQGYDPADEFAANEAMKMSEALAILKSQEESGIYA